MGTERKVAFVTGASSGIGRATAEAFVDRGYATVLVDRQRDAGEAACEALARRGACRFVACDVADDASVRDAVAQTVAAYGRLDAAFNGAGVNGELALTADGSLENWNRVLAIDLTGVWLYMRHQIPEMLKQGGGAIVNCASTAGLIGAERLSAYVAAKHGVVGLTRTASLEYIRRGLRVNAVCPGMTDTPMFESYDAGTRQALAEASPMGRFGRPGEIAEAVVWLCSDAASFVTGHMMTVDGGLTAG